MFLALQRLRFELARAFGEDFAQHFGTPSAFQVVVSRDGGVVRSSADFLSALTSRSFHLDVQDARRGR